MTPKPAHEAERADAAGASFLVGGGAAGGILRGIDGQASGLGPSHAWPQSLRTAVSMCLGSPLPIAIYWGAELVAFYNDALIPMLGANHPQAMGRPVVEALPELRDALEPVLRRVVETGEPGRAEDLILSPVRRGPHEDRCLTFTCSPIRDESDGVGGVFCVVTDTTSTVPSERRRAERQRDNFYRHFLQAPFPIAVLRGPDHVIELANPPMLRAWGMPPEIVGMPILAAIPALRGQPFLGYLDRVYASGTPYHGSAELARLPTGATGELEDYYFDFVYAALRDADGAIEGTLVSAFDVTEQVLGRRERARAFEHEQRARRDAEADRTRIHSLFMRAPAPICIFEGPDHRFTLVNQPYITMVGRDDLIGKAFGEAYPERELSRRRLDHAYATGETFRTDDVQFRFARSRPGELEDAQLNVVYEPFRGGDGEVAGIVVVAFDITDAVRARRESEHARLAAEAAAAAQRELVEFQERFVAVLGHDLRNPLAAIDMAAGLLRQQAEQARDATTIRILSRVRSSSHRMSRMIEQILDLSRSRLGGGLEVQPAPMDLGAMLTTVIDELRTAHPARQIELISESITGVWDRDRLEQVFSNLISNALHHGFPETSVTVSARLDGDRVCVETHNHGPVIPEELRATLFSPFRRGERDSRATKTAGLGLGLYISRELVLSHGGDLDVRSTADAGTTFRVVLPRTAQVSAHTQSETQ
jgi:signal transduction histidine kinase